MGSTADRIGERRFKLADRPASEPESDAKQGRVQLLYGHAGIEERAFDAMG